MSFLSKKDVICAFCEWKGRRDKLTAHTTSKHPNEKPRSKDQGDLSSFFKRSLTDTAQPTHSTSVSARCSGTPDSVGFDSELIEPPSKKIFTVTSEQPTTDTIEPKDAQNVDVSNQIKEIGNAITNLNKKIDQLVNLSKLNEKVVEIENKPSDVVTDDEFETKMKLIRTSKSVDEICNLMPCLEFGRETSTLRCKPCVQNVFCIPKDVAVIKSSKYGFFSFHDEGLDSGSQSMSFRNSKTHIIDHLKSKSHKWCLQYSIQEQQKEALIDKEHSEIALRVERVAYSSVKEGKGGKFFERCLSLQSLNGTSIGELNHSREFYRGFRTNLFLTIRSKIFDFFKTINQATNHLPLVSVVADKITKLHRTFQITCLITLVEGIQTCILLDISPCGTSHKGYDLAKKIEDTLNEAGINCNEQLNGMAFDGQYFDIGVDKKLVTSCTTNMSHEFFLPMWDIAHRIELAVKDVKKTPAMKWVNDQVSVIGGIRKQYNWGIGYEELLNLADELNVDSLNPKMYQDTRFVQSEIRVYNTFLKDFKIFFTDLHRKRCESISLSNNTEAKELSNQLKKFTTPSFLFEVIGITDILQVLTNFSCISQNVNICIWTVFEIFHGTLDVLKNMKTELIEGCVSPKHFPTLSKEVKLLKHNLFHDCALVNDDKLATTRSQEAQADKSFDEEDDLSEYEAFKGSRDKLSTFLKILIEKLELRITQPAIVKDMKTCFSTTSLLDSDFDSNVSVSLKKLVAWVNENRGTNFENDVVLAQLKNMKIQLCQHFDQKEGLQIEEGQEENDLKNKIKRIQLERKLMNILFTDKRIFTDHQDVLYILENCLKTCSEAVCETLGSVIGNHLHNRNIKHDSLYHEVFISWNGPPVHSSSHLLKEGLMKHFGGEKFHFTRFSSKSRLKIYKTSKVVDRLQSEKGRLPFLEDF